MSLSYATGAAKIAKENAETALIAIVALEDLKVRILEAKKALLMVDFEYDLRKGVISIDTMRQVQYALSLVK